MDVKILETGERTSLIIRDENGIEWTNDLIGNAGELIDGQFTWSEEDDAYLVSQDTYDWWSQYISDYEQSEQDIADAAHDLDMSIADVRERVSMAFEGINDYEMHRRTTIDALAELRDEYAVSQAAAALGRKGGKSTSDAKRAAARENGKRGGAPRIVETLTAEERAELEVTHASVIETRIAWRENGNEGIDRLIRGRLNGVKVYGWWRAGEGALDIEWDTIRPNA